LIKPATFPEDRHKADDTPVDRQGFYVATPIQPLTGFGGKVFEGLALDAAKRGQSGSLSYLGVETPGYLVGHPYGILK